MKIIFPFCNIILTLQNNEVTELFMVLLLILTTDRFEKKHNQ